MFMFASMKPGNLSILLVVFYIAGCCNCPPESPSTLLKMPERDTTRRSIVVTIDDHQQFGIGDNKFGRAELDSMLSLKIREVKQSNLTPVVVIQADSGASYGNVFGVMSLSRRDSVKVVANVQALDD
jgi:biopolymer transport protein ExbD